MPTKNTHGKYTSSESWSTAPKDVYRVALFVLLVGSEECNNPEIIVGQLGQELVMTFVLSNLRDGYNNYIEELDGKRIIKNEIQIQNLTKESHVRFKNKMDSTIEYIIFMDGKPTYLAGNQTEIFLTKDAFVVKKTELQKEDAGIYWIEFKLVYLGQKVLIVADTPTIKGLSPPNPVLKPEDNYTTIFQLECHSISTSIGDCQLYNSMYIIWYKNGMRMTDLDPTLSQINVTVDLNGGNFTCLATDYLPCSRKLQTRTYYDNILNVEVCNNVVRSKTFKIKPQYAPVDVKLEPDQREITVDAGEDLVVRCSAKCHPNCDVKWETNFQGLESNDLVTIPKRIFGNELKIENINSFNDGVYSCLVNNTHGEVKKNFTLSVRGTDNKALMSAEMNTVIVAVTLVIAILL